MPPVVYIPSQGPIAGVEVPLSAFGDEQSPSSVTAYLGIPFAQPPTGGLRWKRPQMPAPSWLDKGKSDDQQTVRQSRWQKDPMQNYELQRMFGVRLRGEQSSSSGTNSIAANEYDDEDCLYVNLWVPHRKEDSAAKRPVLVWVYGGGFIVGSASIPAYDGARLASTTGCIVVSITYRVGVLGFLGSRELAADEDDGKAGTGNYGLWDAVAGFEWVQRCIGAFGGDPDEVTAFGESAGAIVLHYLAISDAVPSGLYARMALLSGTAMSVPPRTMPSAQATFDALVIALDPACAGASVKERLAMLRKASVHEMLEALAMMPAVRPRSEYVVDASKGRPSRRMDHPSDTLQFEASSLCGPVWDGMMVERDFLERVVDGLPQEGVRNGQKGILLGQTGDEGSLFTLGMATRGALPRTMDSFSTLQDDVERVYGAKTIKTDTAAKAISSALLSDYIFVAPINTLTAALSRQSTVPAYRYIWSHPPSARLLCSLTSTKAAYNFNANNGVYHGSEVPFLFGWQGDDPHTYALDDYPGKTPPPPHKDGRSSVGFSSAERMLSMQFIGHFAAFARGKAPWTSCSGQAKGDDAMPDIPVMAYDEMPSLGASSPSLQDAVRQMRLTDGERAIPTGETKLYDTHAWKTAVDPDAQGGNVGSAPHRHAFWAGEKMRNMLLYYYGDERIRYVE